MGQPAVMRRKNTGLHIHREESVGKQFKIDCMLVFHDVIFCNTMTMLRFCLGVGIPTWYVEKDKRDDIHIPAAVMRPPRASAVDTRISQLSCRKIDNNSPSRQ